MSSIKKNILLLLFVQTSNYVFPLLTLPYLTRTLGVENFAILAISQAVTQYFVILTTYGFNLTSTKSISVNRHDQDAVNLIFSSTIIAKFLLFLISLILLVVIIFFVDDYNGMSSALYLSFIRVLGEVLFPIWLFQGLEKMSGIVFSTTLAKFIVFSSTFVLVNSKQDLDLAVLIQSMPSLISGAISYYFLFKYKMITGFKISFTAVLATFKEALPIFISSSFSSVYINLNVIILGFYSSAEVVASFAAADKLRLAVQNILSPINQAVFPRVNYKIKNGVKVSEIVKEYGFGFVFFGFLLSFLIFLFGYDVASVYFGRGYDMAAKIFFYLFPLPFIISVAIVASFWVLIPQNKEKFLVYIYMAGAICHILYVFPLVEFFSYKGLIFSVIMTELVITVMMVVLSYRSTIKS